MSVSNVNRTSLNLPGLFGWPICVAGAVGIFATYWDEAWHTDVGRDSFWTPAHLLLYGAMAIVGLSVAAWGLRVLTALRSVRRAAAELPVLAACLGGITALAAAPIDAAWHSAFGRDSVEWSPPHMLVVFAATAIALGALAGIVPDARALRAAAGTLLLANAAAVVFEYEADVPQFAETLYLPILLVAGLLVADLIHQAVPLAAPVAVAVVGYAALRLIIAGVLAVLGRSTPDLPIAVLGFAAYDLPLRGPFQRLAAAAAATAGLAWASSALGLASERPSAVALAAVPVLAVATALLLTSSRWSRRVLPAGLVLLGFGSWVSATADRAEAHDPGEGTKVADTRLVATSDGNGTVTMTMKLANGCDNATPVRLVARRAGQTIASSLRRVSRCEFSGTIAVTEPGRWFVYTELTYAGDQTEAWLPVDSSERDRVADDRPLYVPVGTEPGQRGAEVAAGVPIYLLGLTVLAIGVAAVRRSGKVAAAA